MTASAKVAPSLLTADFARLGEDISRCDASGADYIHFDVMDGSFVPNITFGPALVAACRPLSKLVFDVHLMIDRPDRYADRFIDAGADIVTIHVESPCDVAETLALIKRRGARAGITLRPGTAIEKIEPFFGVVDLVLIMSVEPGFGGQAFKPEALDYVRRVHAARAAGGYGYEIEIDGGIDDRTARSALEAGVDVLVSGSYLFRRPDMSAAMEALRRV